MAIAQRTFQTIDRREETVTDRVIYYTSFLDANTNARLYEQAVMSHETYYERAILLAQRYDKYIRKSYWEDNYVYKNII